ncbi:hypothetical protein PMIN06_011319 [Paraphaeosphaeria minitans]
MKNDVKSTLLLLSTIATSVAHNVNATRHGLQPPIHLSTYGKASLQVIDLLQQLKLSYLAAAKDLRWEDRSTGRLVQDTLRQAHDNEAFHSTEIHKLTHKRTTCNFTVSPQSVDEYISHGRRLASLVTGTLLQASTILAQEDLITSHWCLP